MDAWLAQVYGTNGGSAEDLEKIAQAEMAQNFAQQEGADLSGLSEEQIAMLGNEVLGGGQSQQPGQPQMQGQPQQPGIPQQGAPGGEAGGIDPSQITEEHVAQAQEVLANPQGQDPALVQEAQAIMQVVEQMQAQQAGQPTPEMAKVAEAQAKFEEADFLGRVMAHSFNQESEKIAASKTAGMMHHLHGAGKAVGNAAHAVGAKAQQAGGYGKAGIMSAAHHMKHHPITHGVAAAGGAVLGAGAHHMMHKEATVNAIEKAAMAQAANILSQNGIDPATGQAAPAPAPAIAPAGGAPAPAPGIGAQAALGDLVEKRAYQILTNLGYRFQ